MSPPTLSELRATVALFRELEEDAFKRSARKCFPDGTFDRGQASAFRICADHLERQIAQPVVAEMLAATVKECAS